MLYPDTITSASKECLLKLDEYLELRNIDYTPSIGENWVNEYNKNAEFTEMIANKCTIFRLNFAYSPSWSPFVSSNGLRVYRYTLCEGLAAPFDSYLAYKDFKGRCESYSHPRRFLFFVQQVGVTQINQLNLNLLLLYAESFRNNTQTNIRGINEFLLFLHNNYNIPICLSFFYHYYNMYGKIQWNNIDNDTKTKIIESSNIDQSYKFDVLENFRKDSISFYYEKAY